VGAGVSEETEGQDTGAEAVAGGVAGVDPAAMALALNGASREKADAFLDEQRALAANQSALIADQRHHLHEQFKHLHLSVWEKQLGVMLRVATAIVGIAVAGAVALMVMQASQSNGLLIEPFSVPPDLSARGLTGEVVAAKVLDRLTVMQSQTNTARPAKSYSNAWGEHGIKLEIPETGISLAELDGWLRQKLGNETHVTGEIVRTATGITITARAGDEGAENVSGPDADVDALAVRLAESIYRVTQPYRYAAFLLRHESRAADALPIFKRLALSGSPDDRLWSYNMWAVATPFSSAEARLAIYQRAVAAEPDAVGAYDNLAASFENLGRSKEALQTYKDEYAHLTNGLQRYVPAARIPYVKLGLKASMDQLTGAYHDALPFRAESFRTGVPGIPPLNLLNSLLGSQLGEHDMAAARASLENFRPNSTSVQSAQIASANEDWAQVLKLAEANTVYLKQFPTDRRGRNIRTASLIAQAQAHLGNIAEAEQTIAPTPGNCFRCLITRAQVAELQGQHARANFWFARAVTEAPSFPFSFTEWGKALLARGKPDEAIEKFDTANHKTPHFADPLEGWGEALMAKNQSHLALAKFAEAEKYAPNWGRLHLKWGEALFYAGKKDEAKAQFARAVQLDLTAAEKSELAQENT
jgi:tetratricopeptide (TPR) repeat protein